MTLLVGSSVYNKGLVKGSNHSWQPSQAQAPNQRPHAATKLQDKNQYDKNEMASSTRKNGQPLNEQSGQP